MSGLAARRKWRPSLALVISLLAVILVALPVLVSLLARLHDNQFVRETERSLLAQAAVLSEVIAQDFAAHMPRPQMGQVLSGPARRHWQDRWRPVEPRLKVTRQSIQEPPSSGQPTPRPIVAPYNRLASDVSALLAQAQKTTLAGYAATDPFGRVFAASGTLRNYAIGHIPEIKTALAGRTATALRYRQTIDERHLLTSISRDTSYRVFVAYPIVVGERVIGALYLSRTPIDLRKFLYRERLGLGTMAGAMVAGAGVLGFVFWRLISRPIRGLVAQSQDIANGRRPAPTPLRHYGVRELADLGGSVLSMAQTLTDRSETIRTYTTHVTHELKSPVTAILGAAELLEDDPPASRRTRLLTTIQAEAERMNRLLGRLRDLARAEAETGPAQTSLADLIAAARTRFSQIAIQVEAPETAKLPMDSDQAEMVLTHLLQNACEHGASAVKISLAANGATLTVQDDGDGISAANRAKVLEPFFTTRREDGGTGMGLTIVAAILHRHGAVLRLGDPPQGTRIEIAFPTPPAT